MANKFAEDIRRIARGTRFRGPLGEYSPRDPISEKQIALITDPMALGGGYGNGGLNNETPKSEAPNSESEQEQNEGDQNPALDPNDPNTFYKGGAGTGTDSAAGEGSFDAGDIIDGAAGPQTTNGTSGGVNEITGFTDCESGTPFNLQLDGIFPTPDGWDDPDTPPLIADWELGYYWLVRDTTENPVVEISRQFSRSGAVAATSAAAESERASLEATAPEFLKPFRVEVTGDSPTTYRETVFSSTNFEWAEITADRRNCASDYDDIYCPLEAPTEDNEWPVDGTFDLANKDGNLVTSDFDADAPAPYSSSGKDFCFGDDRTGKILVTADGGTMIYETNAEGAPTGTVRVYGRDGTAQGFGDSTESFISQYLPK